MKIILQKDLDNLGSANEIVEVKSGYARNYLIPQKYAIEANTSNLKHLESILKGIKIKQDKLLSETNTLIEKLKESPVILKAKIGTTEKIYGNITTVQIAREIRDQKGFEIDRKKITIIEDIKTIGVYQINIDFGDNIQETFNVEVIPEETK